MQTEDTMLFEVTGFSMWPFLRSGEKLIIKKISVKDLKLGNIMLYHANNKLVCHRLIKKIKARNRYILYARGDNSILPRRPEAVTEDVFVGVATGILRSKKIINLASWTQVFIGAIIVRIGPLLSRLAMFIRPYVKPAIRVFRQVRKGEKYRNFLVKLR